MTPKTPPMSTHAHRRPAAWGISGITGIAFPHARLSAGFPVLGESSGHLTTCYEHSPANPSPARRLVALTWVFAPLPLLQARHLFLQPRQAILCPHHSPTLQALLCNRLPFCLSLIKNKCKQPPLALGFPLATAY